MEQNNEEQQTSDEEFARALDAALALDPQNATGYKAPARPEGKFELQSISHVHESIMNWMIANPQLALRECAAHFGYTRAWLSTLIHSDIFQARLREKQEAVFSGIKEDIATKLGALADVGVERLQEKLETSDDPKLIMEATKLALSSLGFGQKTNASAPGTQNAQNIQNNYYVASSADLSAARERMREVGSVSSPSLPAPVLSDATPNEPEQVAAPSLEDMRELAYAVMQPPEEPSSD